MEALAKQLDLMADLEVSARLKHGFQSMGEAWAQKYG
jgi:hypothetical protein